MIFYLVCFTFSITYSVLPFHLVYVLQVLHLSFFCFWCSFSRLWCHCYPWGRVIIPKLSSFSLSIRSDQIRSVAQSCLTLCDPMNRRTPGLPVHHHLPEFTQTYVHRVGDAIQPSHPLLSPFPPSPNPSQHQSLFQWVNSSHEVAKVLEFQLQHHFFQRTPRTDLL